MSQRLPSSTWKETSQSLSSLTIEEEAKDIEEVQYFNKGQKVMGKSAPRKIRKLVPKTEKHKQLMWFLTNPDPRGEKLPIYEDGAKVAEDSGTIEQFRRLKGCKLRITDLRTGKKTYFLACMSDDPFVRSITQCPETTISKDIKNLILGKSRQGRVWCHDASVYSQATTVGGRLKNKYAQSGKNDFS
ncbi:hypothetical protein H072_5649 [Dactylellina haptotyla CBS 200.50]|uniref:Uncharacterized protein n=1 Tax=Dactylellina haptotyla (strain CBS 200.50) TaxID=1284197 RepID=S8BYS3_DACHA|nr:hypothetical protein H072_5649 [Dactylellina haptotyla CBS 200.50]